MARPKGYQRSLNIDTALHSIAYNADGIAWRREYFASAPQQVLVFRFTADRRGAYTGTLKWNDAHAAKTVAAGALLTAAGRLPTASNMKPRSRCSPPVDKSPPQPTARFHIENADALTILVAAGTNYVPDRARAWRGDSPHTQIDRQLRTASAKSYTDLRAAHIADYQRLFHRVSLRLASRRARSAHR